MMIVTQAHLAILPPAEGRRAPRRMVNLAASLRDSGSSLIEVEINNLSTSGFMARGAELPVGAQVWLKLHGLEAQACKVVWSENGSSGFEFSYHLHPATLELIAAADRKPRLVNYFGPKGRDRSGGR